MVCLKVSPAESGSIYIGGTQVYIDPDSAGDTFRQTIGHSRPRRSAVDGLVESAVRAASVESRRCAPPLVGSRIQGERARWVHRNVGDTRVLGYGNPAFAIATRID